MEIEEHPDWAAVLSTLRWLKQQNEGRALRWEKVDPDPDDRSVVTDRAGYLRCGCARLLRGSSRARFS
jgi:hypothetical protein